ncbi:MAG: hypothetical protein KatS3mg127_1367 [Silanimonas sp.]|nr:MAG: hypothetical protein KatS3mg127_1367 [Silanimonas sp.]
MRLIPFAGLVLLSAATLAAPVPPVDDSTHRHGFGPEISAEDFRAHVEVLASDEFAGRAPGSVGETKTVAYLVEQLKRLGLKPGNGEAYTQDVPMVETKADFAASRLSLITPKRSLAPALGPEAVVGTRSGNPSVSIEDSELVFVGYGVNAPELGWNDYEGLDVKGKTVVMLINDPGFHVGDETLFGGKRMTYYGRWTYKYEEAARQGAAAALIIHDDAGAAYPWEVVQNSWGGPQFDLPPSEDPEPRLPAQGWINDTTARALFADAGLDFEALRAAASRPGFRAVPLQARLSLTLESSTRSGSSQNVVAVLPGSSRPDEAIVYLAHWDHLGRNFSGRGRPHLQRRSGQCHRRGRRAGDRRAVHHPQNSARAQRGVPIRDPRGIRPARLEVLRRPPAGAAGEDGGGDQPRCHERDRS